MFAIRRLIWEPEVNVAYMREKHGVSKEEVEFVCFGDPVVRDAYAGRVLAIGVTEVGRMLTVVLDAETEPGVFYPVTVR